MTEQEYMNACDLRTWRIVLESRQWISPTETTGRVYSLITDEIARLERIVITEENGEVK